MAIDDPNNALADTASNAVSEETALINEPDIRGSYPFDSPVVSDKEIPPAGSEQITAEEEAALTSSNANENNADGQGEDDVAPQSSQPDDAGTTQLSQDVVIVSSTSNSSSDSSEKPVPLENPLHEYATYTYGITLFVLSKDNYNQLVNGEASVNWNPKYSLISSGGGYKEIRHPEFGDDFYFDNLKMQTIIGMNYNTRGTNAIELSFTIIEPYGLTLLDRLVAVGNDPRVGSGNYVGQPYLLQIDFFGAKELGDISAPIPKLRKRIPIQFIKFDIKVGTKGTEYNISAVPYNHSAFTEAINSTPANFEITSSTVGEFFKDQATDAIKRQQKAKEKARADAILYKGVVNDDEGNPIALPKGQRVGPGGDEKKYLEAEKIVNTPYKVESYAGAWNAWQQTVADSEKVNFPNEILFEFDKELLESPIVDPTKMPYGRSSMPAPGTQTNKTTQQTNDKDTNTKTPSNNFDPKKMIFSITSGTSIVDVVNLVMKNSDYIKKQVIDPVTDKNTFAEERTIDYFKILPKVVLKEFDEKRGEFAKQVTYYVKKYQYYNTKHPNLPKAKPQGSVKEYNYIYTGKNIDIIDVSIDFNSMFFTPITTNPEKTEATSGAPAASDGDAQDSLNRLPAGRGTVTPNVHRPQSGDATAHTTGSDTTKTVLVADAMKSIYSSSRGDMLNVKLRIIGDPHFIKQDDIYTNPGQKDYNPTKQLLNDGTLVMDNGEIFCTLNFHSPVDMDDSTGLLRENEKYKTTSFSGYYKIQVVESEFSRGQFTQTLDLIRIFDDNVETDKKKKAEKEREEQKARASRALYAETDPRRLDKEPPTSEQVDPPDDTLGLPPGAEPDLPPEKERFELNPDNDEDPELKESEDQSMALNNDLEDAPELDITDQRAADNSSPTPENIYI